MSIDWKQITNLASLLTVLIAIIALIVQNRQSQKALQTDALMSILLRFDSDKIRAFRRMAATYLLNKGGSRSEAWAVEEILDFFGEIAFFINSKTINGALAYSQFSWWLIRYWLSSKEFVKIVREYDPYSWAMLEKIANKLHKEEKKEGYTDEDYSDAMLNRFLEEESRLLIVDAQIGEYVMGFQKPKKRTVSLKTKK